MYSFELTEPYFPAQTDAQLLSTTVGELLRNTASGKVQKFAIREKYLAGGYERILDDG